MYGQAQKAKVGGAKLTEDMASELFILWHNTYGDAVLRLVETGRWTPAGRAEITHLLKEQLVGAQKLPEWSKLLAVDAAGGKTDAPNRRMYHSEESLSKQSKTGEEVQRDIVSESAEEQREDISDSYRLDLVTEAQQELRSINPLAFQLLVEHLGALELAGQADAMRHARGASAVSLFRKYRMFASAKEVSQIIQDAQAWIQQYVEARLYDDDEPEAPSHEETMAEVSGAARLRIVEEAIARGLRLKMRYDSQNKGLVTVTVDPDRVMGNNLIAFIDGVKQTFSLNRVKMIGALR